MVPKHSPAVTWTNSAATEAGHTGWSWSGDTDGVEPGTRPASGSAHRFCNGPGGTKV